MNYKKRNLSSSVDAINVSGNEALWTDWTIAKAVNEGFQVCGWVYKAISLISRNASSVPFAVRNKDNEIEWDHPLTVLLLNPHPVLNRVQFFELLTQWLQLAGNAYLKIADDSKEIRELWPVSPDRIAPIESKDNSLFVDGYETLNDNGSMQRNDKFTTDNVIHLSLMNPAQPLVGISPLQAVAKSVDADVAQQDWNTSAMQNRGVVEGVFTFKKDLDKKQADSILQRIINKFAGKSNARKPLVLGSEAQYTRLSLTVAEMDFLNSRKFNRDEIFAIFGVPPQLAGSMEASTFNNFSTSMRIFWESTIIPLLNLMATQFTSSFADRLDNGRYISYDLSDVAAIRENETEKATTSKLYFDMGVPFKQINTRFELGFEEFIGWDLPFSGKETTTQEPGDEERKLVLIPTEKRDAKAEANKRDKIAEGPAKDAYALFLDKQRTAVFAALDKGEDPVDVVKGFKSELVTLTTNVIVGVASQFAETVVVTTRGEPLNFQKRGDPEDELINEFLQEEQVILTEASAIQDSTAKTILDQVRNASEKGFNVEKLRQALDDTGVFSPARALRIARTEVGTAASIGQFSAAKLSGAEFKTWEIAGTETRKAHIERDQEKVKIDERFSKQISDIGPRFVLDPQISAADRINCDCFLTFSVD